MATKLSGFDIEGGKDFERKLLAAGPGALKAAGGSLYRSAEQTMGISKDRYCPVNTGALKSTGTVALPDISGTEVRVQLGYGGPSVDYAVVVHETNLHYRGGKSWKYLETPLKEGLSETERALVNDVNNYLETLA